MSIPTVNVDVGGETIAATTVGVGPYKMLVLAPVTRYYTLHYFMTEAGRTAFKATCKEFNMVIVEEWYGDH